MSRFKCHSDLYDMELMLDVNVSIYPLKVLLHSAPAPASSIISCTLTALQLGAAGRGHHPPGACFHHQSGQCPHRRHL